MKNSGSLKTILAIVAKASREILTIFDLVNTDHGCIGALNIKIKDNATPFTVADELANSILIEGLTANFSLPVLSEEGKTIPFEQRAMWSAYWCIDPLDGTKEFIAGIGEFTVNVALVINGRSVLGVVAAPVSGEVFIGASIKNEDELRIFKGILGGSVSGCEAPFCLAIKTTLANESVTGEGELNWQSIQVSDVSSPLRVLTSRHHHGQSTKLALSLIGSLEEIAMGSSLKMCRIAEGIADLYLRFGPTSEWDTAAAQAVLEGAGGHLLGMSGKPLTYNKKASLINPPFFASGQSIGINLDGLMVLKERKFNADDD